MHFPPSLVRDFLQIGVLNSEWSNGHMSMQLSDESVQVGQVILVSQGHGPGCSDDRVKFILKPPLNGRVMGQIEQDVGQGSTRSLRTLRVRAIFLRKYNREHYSRKYEPAKKRSNIELT